MNDFDFGFAVAAAIIVAGSYLMIGFMLWLRHGDQAHPNRINTD